MNEIERHIQAELNADVARSAARDRLARLRKTQRRLKIIKAHTRRTPTRGERNA